MKISKEIINLVGNRKFVTVRFDFDFQSSDDATFSELRAEAEKLASKVNPTLARDSSMTRGSETVMLDSIGGVIAEFCWRYWLNSESKRLGIDVSFKRAEFMSPAKQIDILVEYADGSQKKAEVRSSFAYKGVESAILRNFDIIGWYTNPVKKEEPKKDYYLRVVYGFAVSKLLERIRVDPFSVYLTGGATRGLLETSPNSKDKEFTPYDEADIGLGSGKGIYRVVEPIANGYDTDKITDLILKGISL